MIATVLSHPFQILGSILAGALLFSPVNESYIASLFKEIKI